MSPRLRDPRAVARAVRAALTPDLLSEQYRRIYLPHGRPPLVGHCYVASEAAFHLLGGKRAGWKPMFIRHEGEPHWFLVNHYGRVLDITASQFVTPVPYARGIGKGFLTKKPSARARIVIARVRARSRT